MANNYADGMPDGLTFKSEKQKQDLTYGASEKALTQFHNIAKQLGTHNTDLQEEITDLIKQQQKLYKRFDEEQVQRSMDAKLLKQKGASDEEIVAYLSKRQDTYEKDTKALFDSFENLHRTLEGWIEGDESLSGENRVLLRKQLETFQKSYDLDEQLRQENEKDKKKRNAILDNIAESVRGTWKEALENGKEERKDALSSLAASFLGPLRLIVDPIAEITTGKTSKQLASGLIEKIDEKRKEKDFSLDKDKELESFLNSTVETSIKDSLPFTEDRYLEESEEESFKEKSFKEEKDFTEGTENSDNDFENISNVFKDILNEESVPGFESSEEENPLLQESAPIESSLLKKGGIVGASAVFLAKEIRKLKDDIQEIDSDENEGLLGGGLKKTLTKIAPTIASAAGVAAVAAVPLAMVAGGIALEKRDAEDASKYAEKGQLGRAAETAWLGDRERLTEDNANSELGRATGKTALIAGGAAGVTALAAGGASAGLAAGTAAAAGGAGLAATGLAAAGATAGAIFPPILIAAAIGAAATVVAKGTQEAFELGWDKNQAEIQKNLYDTIYSKDSSIWEKIKASFTSDWKEFTGTIAGGIRGFSEELEGDAAIEWERGIEYLERTAAEGNKENARLLTLLQDEKFKSLSEKDQEMILQSEGLFEEYENMLDESKNSFGESLLNGLRATGDFFKGAIDTKMNSAEGKKGAAIDAQLLKDFDKITEDDVERLKNSTTYLEALSEGKNQKQAMQSAYLEEKHKENAALGIQKEDGTAVGLNDYAVTLFKKKKTEEDYRQTHEYSQEKALLMQQGLTSEEADLKAIEEYNEMYEQAMEYRLKQTKDYREFYKKSLKEGKSMAQAEKDALNFAKENKRNTQTLAEIGKEKLSTLKDTVKETFSSITEKISEGFDSIQESEFGQVIGNFVSSIWEKVSEWFGKIGDWFSNKWEAVTQGLSNVWGDVKEGAGNAWDWITGKSSEDKTKVIQMNDGIVTKDGQIIQLSPDDSVYATKNEPTVIGDRDAQRAMPSVPKERAEFTDKGIIAAIQTLTEVLKAKNMTPEISIPDNSTVSFDDFRIA